MAGIVVRPLHTLEEMQAVVELQKMHWGDDIESIIPAHMLFSLANYGGHVLGALDEGKVVGALIGFLGTSTAPEESDRPAMADLQMVSKRMVVLSQYRNQGIGYQLKLAQRARALKQGVRLVTWTFDPLMAVSAHLNIRKLGAISQLYHDNYYGTREDGRLTILGSSDRLLAEWWITHSRVEEHINGDRRDLALSQYLDANAPILNPTVAQTTGAPWPPEQMLAPRGPFVLLEIPAEYRAVVESDVSLAQTWRAHVRVAFHTLLARGYLVTDFLREHYQGRDRAFYLLSQSNPQFDFSLN